MRASQSKASGEGERRIDAIDGLRAIAMTMVIAQHCRLMPFGWTGVWLFFVISGYVISRNFIQRRQIERSPYLQYKLFIMRRIFRIVPLYLLYVAVGTVLIILFDNRNALDELPWLLSFFYNWQMIFHFAPAEHAWPAFGHLWTLSVEEQFYLVFPLLILFSSRRFTKWTIVLLICVGPLLRYGFSLFLVRQGFSPGNTAFGVYASSFCQFDAFLMGALLAHCESEIRRNPKVKFTVWTISSTAFVIYVSTYVLINIKLNGAIGIVDLKNIISGILYGQHREVFVYSVVDFISASIIISAMLDDKWTRWLKMPSLTLVGRISYGGYVYHALVLWLVEHLTPFTQSSIGVRLFWFVIVWLLTVAIAYVSFDKFEGRFLALSRSISERVLTREALLQRTA